MQKKSLFIVIEGLDGSGKTSVSKVLQQVLHLENQSNIKLTFEPHDPSCAGLYIRQVLMKKITTFSPKTLALAFAANRLDHIDREINPWLAAENRMVICDRYYLSSLVYQSSDEFPFESVLSLNDKARKPDIIFFFNVSNQVCYERLKKRNQPQELFESNLAQTRDKFLKAIAFLREKHQENIIEIDANGTIEETAQAILNHIFLYAPAWKLQQENVLNVENAPITFVQTNYAIPDFIREIKSNNIQSPQNRIIIYEKLNQITNSKLQNLFFDFMQSKGFSFVKTWVLEAIEVLELTYQMPFGLNLRGFGLFVNMQIPYAELLKIVPELQMMSDFILILDLEAGSPVVDYFEREKIQFNQSSQQGLFPTLSIINKEMLGEYIHEMLMNF